MASLDSPKVLALLQNYESTKVTDELYEMGKILMQEASERISLLDSKAVTVAGYTGAIIGLMVTTFPIWSSAVDKWAIGVAALGTLIGLIGGAMALEATWPKLLGLPSDTDWIEADSLHDPDRLKRHYIASLHLSIASHEEVNATKVASLKASQALLAVMVALLVIVLGNATYKAVRRPSQPASGQAGSTASCPQ